MSYFAIGYRVVRDVLIGLGDYLCDGIAFPDNRISVANHLGLSLFGRTGNIDLVEDSTVAYRGGAWPIENSISEHLSVLSRISSIYLIIYRARRACAYVLAYRARRNGVDCQMESVVCADMSICIDGGVCPDTGGVVALTGLCPDERCIGDTDGLVQTGLFYYVQDTEAVATGSYRSRHAVVASLGDGHAVPIDRLAERQDLGFRMFLNGRYMDLQIDDTVASRSRAGLGRDGIVVERVTHRGVSSVLFTIDELRIAGTNIVLTDDARNGIYFEVQGMEFFDEAVLEDRIGVDAGCVELVSSPSCVGSVEYADGLVLTLLGYDT